MDVFKDHGSPAITDGGSNDSKWLLAHKAVDGGPSVVRVRLKSIVFPAKLVSPSRSPPRKRHQLCAVEVLVLDDILG